MTILMGLLLDVVLFNAQFVLTGVRARNKFVEGKRTDEIEGFSYQVTDLTSLKALSVFVPQSKPLMTHEEILAANASGKRIFVEFTDGVITPYVNRKTGTIDDSIKAAAIQLVKS